MSCRPVPTMILRVPGAFSFAIGGIGSVLYNGLTGKGMGMVDRVERRSRRTKYREAPYA